MKLPKSSFLLFITAVLLPQIQADELNLASVPGAQVFNPEIYFYADFLPDPGRSPAQHVEITDTGINLVTAAGQFESSNQDFNVEYGNYNSKVGRYDRLKVSTSFDRIIGSTDSRLSDFYQEGEVIHFEYSSSYTTPNPYAGLEPGSNWFVYSGVDVSKGGPYQYLQELVWVDRGSPNIVDSGDIFAFGKTYYLEKNTADDYTFEGYKVDIPETAHLALLGGLLTFSVTGLSRRRRVRRSA